MSKRGNIAGFRGWRQLENFLAQVGLVIVIAIMLFPIIWMFLTSIKTRVDALAMPPKWIFLPTLRNYTHVFKGTAFYSVITEISFGAAFVNSIIVAFASIALALLIGVPAAYAFSRFSFRGKQNMAFWILTTRMAPPIVLLIPFYLMYRSLGLLDTRIGLIIMHVTLNLALVVWMMRGFFQEIPVELEEAALVDGCTPLQAFRTVILPLCLNGIVATAVLSFIFSWNELMFAIVLTRNVAKTAPAAVYNFIGYQEIMWGQLCASGIVVIVPVFVFILVAQKYLIRGLTFGALK